MIDQIHTILDEVNQFELNMKEIEAFEFLLRKKRKDNGLVSIV